MKVKAPRGYKWQDFNKVLSRKNITTAKTKMKTMTLLLLKRTKIAVKSAYALTVTNFALVMLIVERRHAIAKDFVQQHCVFALV